MLERLRQLPRHKPFSPFRVLMRSGQRYDIVDPGRVAIGRTRVFLVAAHRMAELKDSEIELVYEPRRSRRH